MALRNFEISKTLSEADITYKRVELPVEIMERMNPVMNGRNSVRLTAVDIMGKQWPLIYYTRPNGNPCPVLRWCQFLNDRPVLRGDKLIFSRQQDAGEMRYMIQVKRRTKTREGETVDVEVVKSPTPMTFRGEPVIFF